MQFEITSRDEKGNPTQVATDDGFMQTSRPFVAEEDGWMEDQIDPRRFPIINAGRQMESLVHEVNTLRRENFDLRRQLNKVNDAFFGRKPD